MKIMFSNSIIPVKLFDGVVVARVVGAAIALPSGDTMLLLNVISRHMQSDKMKVPVMGR